MIILDGVAFVFSVSARLAAAVMTDSSGVMVGFVMYLCLKILSLILLVRVSHLSISSKIGSAHTMCLVRMPFGSVMQPFCAVLVSHGVKLSFQ